MKKILFSLGIILVALLVFQCATVPVTGRKQLSLVSNSELLPMSFQSYQAVLDSSDVDQNTADAQSVKLVGQRIQKAVETYMADNGWSEHLDGYEWDYNVIDEDVVNAWCMPGGKVVFYTGILPICQDEAGIAVVMGHEIAHAVANHGAERMSQGMAQQLGGAALNVALSESPATTQKIFNTAYGVASTYGAMLPYSRLHESEADQMGLIFMAMAGYDPHEAPKFWERMKEKSGGSQPPEFMSTHPAHDKRIQELKEAIPDVMKYYNP